VRKSGVIPQTTARPLSGIRVSEFAANVVVTHCVRGTVQSKIRRAASARSQTTAQLGVRIFRTCVWDGEGRGQ